MCSVVAYEHGQTVKKMKMVCIKLATRCFGHYYYYNLPCDFVQSTMLLSKESLHYVYNACVLVATNFFF